MMQMVEDILIEHAHTKPLLPSQLIRYREVQIPDGRSHMHAHAVLWCVCERGRERERTLNFSCCRGWNLYARVLKHVVSLSALACVCFGVALRWLVRPPAEERRPQQLRHRDLLPDGPAGHAREHAAGALLPDHCGALLQHATHQRAAGSVLVAGWALGQQLTFDPPPRQATLSSAGPGGPTASRGCASSSSRRRLLTTWRAAWRPSCAPWRRRWRT